MLDTAHEIRNHLTVILGFADCGLEERKPAADCFRQIIDAAGRIEKVLKLLFEQSRSGHGPLDLNLVVGQLASALAALPGPTVELKVLCANDLPAGPIGDATVLFGALFNLCLNACKAMPKGGTLRLATFAATGAVGVTIGDTGCGMTPEKLLTLWDGTLSADNEHGRGLSIVRSTVEELGGRVEVQSSEDVGSTFTILLPACGMAGAK
jgi:signal transduction histidine kinase